jgi:organic radical activating enzyme
VHPSYKFDQRVKIKKIEFYITNVCNLTCDRCNRYNNHDFKGWQNWADFESEYAKWAQHINIQQIVILGGEPLLNPSILDWVRGINQLWRKPVQILTNGTRLNHVRGLYDLLSDKTYTNFVGISWHNTESLQELESTIFEFLAPDAQKLPDNDPMVKLFGADFVYQDSNDINIPVWIQDHFSEASLKSNNGIFSLHNNDPLLAHERCGFVKHGSYHFIRGKLYKCGPVALLPEFDSQHLIDMSDEDRALLNSYKPLCADDFESLGSDFLDNIDNPIPQCKFCPVNSDFKKILAIRKNS